jgi:hypothetical protein
LNVGFQKSRVRGGERLAPLPFLFAVEEQPRSTRHPCWVRATSRKHVRPNLARDLSSDPAHAPRTNDRQRRSQGLRSTIRRSPANGVSGDEYVLTAAPACCVPPPSQRGRAAPRPGPAPRRCPVSVMTRAAQSVAAVTFAKHPVDLITRQFQAANRLQFRHWIPPSEGEAATFDPTLVTLTKRALLTVGDAHCAY